MKENFENSIVSKKIAPDATATKAISKAIRQSLNRSKAAVQPTARKKVRVAPRLS
jgi:hypothetical protein